MRYFLLVLCVLMVLFGAVQYNDPDGLWWAIIYFIPAAFAGAAFWRPAFVASTASWYALLGAIALAVAGVAYYWPATENFWRVDVWWHTETAREGMGMMIALVVLLIVMASTRRRRANS